jgi:hypothetical protein
VPGWRAAHEIDIVAVIRVAGGALYSLFGLVSGQIHLLSGARR